VIAIGGIGNRQVELEQAGAHEVSVAWNRCRVAADRNGWPAGNFWRYYKQSVAESGGRGWPESGGKKFDDLTWAGGTAYAGSFASFKTSSQDSRDCPGLRSSLIKCSNACAY
jgi:hypothetical protein